LPAIDLETSSILKTFALKKQKRMHTIHPVYLVSLGPGDPELITLKGLKTLQEADIIYCPATVDAAGNVSSRAAEIVAALGVESERRTFVLPMSRDRSRAEAVYDALFAGVMAEREKAGRIAVVAEGDAGFYSSGQYLCDKFASNGVAVRRIAGVPAFIAAGALAGLHIARQDERLHVAPGKITAEELSGMIERGDVTVIMKLSQCVEAIHACIGKYPEVAWHYFENIGTEREYYTADRELIRHKKYPYFSLMIVCGSRNDEG
jgi:precorrin-2/cobalt-factor-2 C20-methyltransferase